MLEFFTKVKNFLKDVAHDTRIPERDKKVLLAMIVLLFSPLDLIPDWIPIFGLMDDFVILCLILDYFFSVLDHQILLSHYPWGMKSFTRMRKFAQMFSIFVPRILKKVIWKYAKLPY